MRLCETMRRNVATVVAGILVVAGFFALTFALVAKPATTSSLVALVHDGDGTTYELPLDEDATLAVDSSLGHNTVIVEDGSVRMGEADCPQGSCLTQQPISRPGQQIICLPHQLWIEVVERGGTQGQMDEGAVSWQDTSDVDFVSR